MTVEVGKIKCLRCPKLFSGNENKLFCSLECKNAYHNARRKQEAQEIGAVISILKTNRRIIGELLDGENIKKVRTQRLLDKGFIFRYHTHTRVNKGDSKEYIFCFDVGYLQLSADWCTIVRAFRED
jgi:hypothetical protein